MSSSSLPQPGEVVADKYRIEEPLGEGGMAVVFAAHHLALDKPVALKILSPELPRLPQLRERFLIEARAAARVDSPHVARVMDVGTLPSGLPYMVLERLEGCDLDELLRVERRLAIGDAVDYVLQALQGLSHAHTLGVIHRDLKPANLFLAHQTDGSAIIKILDFGIAKLTASEPGESVSRHTQQGQAVGTPMYMSPEHVRNDAFVDHRTDIWAMGVVLYELITGETPFEADGIGETFGAVLNRKPSSSLLLRPEIPAALDAAILKCLEQDVDDRWSDVAQFARAIGPYGTGACSFLVESIEQTLRQRLRRYSGKAMMVRPATSGRASRTGSRSNPNAMGVTLEAPAISAISPGLSKPAPPARGTAFDLGAQDPMSTPIPESFPGLRPRWGRWGVAFAVMVLSPIAYVTFFADGASAGGFAAASAPSTTAIGAAPSAAISSGTSDALAAASAVPSAISAKGRGATSPPRKSKSAVLAKPRP